MRSLYTVYNQFKQICMKPWLLNILACPIDKHHPLDSRFFSWETTPEEMRKIVSEAGVQSPHFRKGYRHVVKQLKDGTISPQALETITDLTGSNDSKILLEKALESIQRIQGALDQQDDEFLGNFSTEIDILYRFLNLIEVDSGLLVCNECGRWYPVGSAVETIPELLPDDLRERERDLTWLRKWRDLVPESVLRDGKPVNLKE